MAPKRQSNEVYDVAPTELEDVLNMKPIPDFVIEKMLPRFCRKTFTHYGVAKRKAEQGQEATLELTEASKQQPSMNRILVEFMKQKAAKLLQAPKF